MQQNSKLGPLVIVIFIGIVLQGLFILIDVPKESPLLALHEFTQAYYKLDPAMADRLCSELSEDEEFDLVDTYLYRQTAEAQAEGYDTSFKKSQLFHTHYEIIEQGEDSATIRLTAQRKRAINPVFFFVAKLPFFDLGNTYDVDEVFNLVKEDGQWKVCGASLSLQI
jgi:hypothetical protein